MIKFSTNIPKDYIALNWCITKYCQFNCHYCTSKDFLVSVKKIGMEKAIHHDEELLATHDRIADLLPKVIKKGHVFFTGGDPSAHPKAFEYFNSICEQTVDNPDFRVLLSTHGDTDKLLDLNPGNKKEHMIVVSFHMIQVRDRFDKWIEGVKKLNDKGYNVLFSGVIPRQEKQWEEFKNYVERVYELGIPIEIKPEICRQTLRTDERGLNYMKELYVKTTKGRGDLTTDLVVRETIIEDDKNNKQLINNIRISNNIPLEPGRTFCYTKQFEVNSEADIVYTCGQGGKKVLSPNTNREELSEFIYQPPLRCNAEFCIWAKWVPEATILGVDLTYDKYAHALDEYFDGDLND